MSTTTVSPQQRRSPPSPDGGAVPDHYIEAQLNRTGRDVKLVDLFSALMVLIAGIVGYLLVVAVVDHWILPLAVWGRWLLLIAMATAALWYCIAVVLPLIIGRINPIYAAWTIERSEPSLKNSVINYLLFRQDRAGLRAGIYETLKQRAASDLAQVPVDSAVDRTRLIHIGYGLIAILVLFAAYTILLPKSPLTTARRVIFPWADIEAPTRVRIEEVTPGSQQVFHGDTINVSAKCYDVYEDEPVTLFYSSLDGRISEQTIRMQTDRVGARYQSFLPPDGDGIQQDLIYRIEAGDAVTASYRLTVLPAPTLLVQQVEYEYPAYTRQPPRVVERQGDVRGVEGTRVTIRAQANQPIRWATIVLDPVPEGDAAEQPNSAATSQDAAARIVSMQSDDRQAWGTFTLEMEPNGIRPKHTAYQLRFETEEGQPNSHAPLHRIEVTRDLTPEIEILTPTLDRIELPVDRRQQIEVRAIDPDYGLRTIQLRAVAGGVDLLSKTLLDDAEGRIGQVVSSFDFEPWKHGLNPGDALVFWAVAADNRVSPTSGDAEPNLAKTRTYHITILPPENPPVGASEPTPADPNEDPNAPPNPAERPEAGPTDRQTSSDEAAKPDPADGAQGDQAGGQETGDSGDSAAGDSGAEGGSSPSSPSDSQQGGTGSSTSADSAGESQAGGGSRDSSSAAGQAGEGEGQTTGGGAQNSDGSGMQGSPSGDGGPSSSSTSPGQGAGGDQQPPSSGGAATATGQQATGDEPLHDGEVIERTLEHMKSQEAADSSTPQPGSQAGGQPQPASGANDQQQPGSGADGSQGDRPQQAQGNGSATSGSPRSGSPEPGGNQDPNASSQPNQQQGEVPMGGGGPQQEDRNQGAGQQQDASAGQGGNPQGPAETRPETSQNDSRGGEPKQGGLGDNGQSGSGQDSEDTSGSAAAEKRNQDRPKSGSASGGEPKPSEGAQAPSQSDRQSDSQGDSEGDQSGGGRKGPGQGSGQSGNDSSGSQSSADQGAGASQESGSGDTARRPGDQQVADDPTNSPGTQKAPGSSTQATPGSQGRGGGAKSDSQSDSQAAERPTGQPTPGEVDHRGQGLPLGGGRPSAADLNGFDLTGEVPPGEEPNVEYARRATDLVLEYLKDQQQKPDPKLLEKLGWTEDDLRQFLQRWEEMRRTASRDEQGGKDLNESLRSLGLRPNQRDARQVTVRNDQVQGLRDAGERSNPPPKYLEQFNAYKKGTARVHE